MQMDLVLETEPAITSRVGRKPITLTINPNGRQLALFFIKPLGHPLWIGAITWCWRKLTATFLPTPPISMAGLLERRKEWIRTPGGLYSAD